MTVPSGMSLGHEIAAIDRHDGASHECGRRRTQERDHARYIVRLAPTPERRARENRVALRLVVTHDAGQWCGDPAGRNGIDANALPGVCDGECLGELSYAALACSIGWRVRPAKKRIHRRGIDDTSC